MIPSSEQWLPVAVVASVAAASLSWNRLSKVNERGVALVYSLLFLANTCKHRHHDRRTANVSEELGSGGSNLGHNV